MNFMVRSFEETPLGVSGAMMREYDRSILGNLRGYVVYGYVAAFIHGTKAERRKHKG
jgi:hypothetical protein